MESPIMPLSQKDKQKFLKIYVAAASRILLDTFIPDELAESALAVLESGISHVVGTKSRFSHSTVSALIARMEVHGYGITNKSSDS